ncbi:MAG: hypothetical protein COU32_00455 [Candidatus Magasanikbacteria bacterium CG10_big_fil_rev_8_21_14_0_10_42_10]|uniref:Dipeptidylpeptidase IV N-terminal domain-containing protein n=1 Tax=Candidatus Magasanikbacteria bacterium CG10_big_fil_rev_8_21_14_0_10_42_10 TaxID=1974649 RepID=A0A2H0TX66_9BACT|nr:MAG: hypothetical protein COU32_00455 [Candidatus Magasanikbacteria bacterium CG10_big_fil_rev_8_21_14_0_10_42_10]
MDKKRILYISLFILLTIGFGYALYRVFFASKQDTTVPTDVGQSTTGQFPSSENGQPSQNGGTGTGSLPGSGTVTAPGGGTQAGGAAEPIVTRVIDTPVSNATPDANGAAKFYNNIDGKFYRINADGSVTALSDTTFFNVSNVTWSPAREEAIIEYPDGANIYYSFDTKTQTTLPTHWQDFSFDKTGNDIVAKSIGFSEENRWLIVSDPQGKTVTPVEPLGKNADKVIVDWSPSGDVIALSRTGEAIAADRQEVLLVGQHGENFKSIVVEGRDLRTKWSPDGEKLLHSVYSARDGYIPELWIVGASGDAIGSGRKLLGVNTWADKCTFADSRYVYCGVPTTLETGSGFVPALADGTPDNIIRIDTQTGLKQPIGTDGTHTVNDMFVNDDGHTLYFTDKTQAGLFSVPL